MQIQEPNLQHSKTNDQSNLENSERQESPISQPEKQQEQSIPSELAQAGAAAERSLQQNYSDLEHSREQIRSNREGPGGQAHSLADSVDQVLSEGTANPKPQSKELILKEESQKSILRSSINPWNLDPEFNNMRQARDSQEQLKNLLEDKKKELLNEKAYSSQLIQEKNRLQQQFRRQNEEKHRYKAKIKELEQKIELYQIENIKLNLVNFGNTLNYGQFTGCILNPCSMAIYGVDTFYFQHIFNQVQLIIAQFLQKKQKVKNLQDELQKLNHKLKAQLAGYPPNHIKQLQTTHTLFQNLQQQLSQEQQLIQDCQSKLNQLKQKVKEQFFTKMEDININNQLHAFINTGLSSLTLKTFRNQDSQSVMSFIIINWHAQTDTQILIIMPRKQPIYILFHRQINTSMITPPPGLYFEQQLSKTYPHTVKMIINQTINRSKFTQLSLISKLTIQHVNKYLNQIFIQKKIILQYYSFIATLQNFKQIASRPLLSTQSQTQLD